jgi:SNF2 family DNA or RNA helicase
VHIIEGTRPQPLPPDVRWVIANYDVLARHLGTLAGVAWAGLVFDEAHYLKNHTSARSRIARDLTNRAAETAAREPAVYLLTGTPLTNRPRDLFVLLQLAGHPLGRSFLSFAKRYCAAERTEYGWKTDGASNLAELTLQLHGTMLRRTKGDVLALPPKLRTWLPIAGAAGIGTKEIREVVALLLARRAGRSKTTAERSRTHLLALLTRARQKIAMAKVETTLELARGAVEQGEKVIVFSCFEAPLETLARALGSSAVVLTGKVPSGERQHLIDRFQRDDDTRVFLANIIAGGAGVTLTAATQVVFNDLDWVPANHWQAEDRAYRLGQTRTVNVTYVVAEHTIDEFVQAVLETKAALVRNVIDGEALADDGEGSVLAELERALGDISPGLADRRGDLMDERAITDVLRAAAEQWRQSHVAASADGSARLDPVTVQSLRSALETLARVLAGPRGQRFRIASASRAGGHYVVDVEGGDVTCSCPGFEYRGQCRHAREVKTALASGGVPPPAYVAIS